MNHASTPQALTAPVSLVVSTLGRSHELSRLLNSLSGQTVRALELIIVDQNSDDRLLPVLNAYESEHAIRHVRRPGERGLSRGRNVGLRMCAGEYVIFPDDDCWYPSWFLQRALEIIEKTGSDGLCGRAADENGHSINGRFESQAQEVNRRNVWTTQIEWVAMFRRDALLKVSGYNEEVGVGAATPWQACEGQDMTLRMLKQGLRIYYDPGFYGHHENMYRAIPDQLLIRKGRSYGRGMGRVLRLHGYTLLTALMWALRPILRGGQAITRLRWRRSLYCFNVAYGRISGYLDLA